MDQFDAFFRTHMRFVYAVAISRGVTPCEAEDLTQETFLRAWSQFRQVSAFEPPAQRAWLRRVLHNLANDAWQRSRSAGTAQEEPLADTETLEQMALRLDVARALAELDESDREIVVMRYLAQMNSREISDLLQIPEGTIRRRLMGCRNQLADQLMLWAPREERS